MTSEKHGFPITAAASHKRRPRRLRSDWQSTIRIRHFAKLILPVVLLAAFSAFAAEPPRKVVIPFDFQSKFDDDRYGQLLGDMIWKKLSREPRFIIPESMLDVRDYCTSHDFRPTPGTDLATMENIVHKGFGAQIAIWGSVERVAGAEGEIYDLTIKCFDFSVQPPQKIYDATARTKSVSEIPHVHVKRLLDALSGNNSSLPPTVAVIADENWRKLPNLIAGDFEHGVNGVPKGWDKTAGQQREPLGHQVQWTAEGGNARNKILRFTLDRNTAENEGLMYYSDFFPIEEGATYRFQCRWRSEAPAVKVFLKCYDHVSESVARREVYRSQQNLKGLERQWNTHTEDFTPRHTKYSPQWCRIMLYAYLNPGSVEFDDVIVKQISAAPLSNASKERRPSSQSKITVEEMETNQRRSDAANRQQQ